MNNYHHPAFYSHVPTPWLYSAMMGEGALYRIKEGIVLYAPSYKKPLPCGCAGQQAYLVLDEEGNKLLKELTHEETHSLRGQALEHINLQGEDSKEFWEAYYQKNPWTRPLKINNLR